MISHHRHAERHRSDRIGWLRAAVLGANDGIVSTASLVVGVAASSASQASILLTGVAALVAGAMSMAAGEYVSVHSQADTEQADLARERAELAGNPDAEHRELAAIYVTRGLAPELAQQVATQLMQHDALGAHARDELGISKIFSAQPVQAALASAASFAVGAFNPAGLGSPLMLNRFDGERPPHRVAGLSSLPHDAAQRPSIAHSCWSITDENRRVQRQKLRPRVSVRRQF